MWSSLLLLLKSKTSPAWAEECCLNFLSFSSSSVPGVVERASAGTLHQQSQTVSALQGAWTRVASCFPNPMALWQSWKSHQPLQSNDTPQKDREGQRNYRVCIHFDNLFPCNLRLHQKCRGPLQSKVLCPCQVVCMCMWVRVTC